MSQTSPSTTPWHLLCSPQVIETAKNLTVLSFCLEDSTLFGVVSRTSEPSYYRTVTIRNGKNLCSCFGSLKSQLCSHGLCLMMTAAERSDIAPILKSLLTSESSNLANAKEPPYVKTDLRGFNSLVGGMPVGSLFGLFGMPASNKSILAMQMAWTFLKYGANALLFDTEGGAGDFALGPWVDALNKRYDSQIATNRVEFDFDKAAWTFQNPPEKSNTFFVVDARDIITVLKIHGYKMRLEISDPTMKVVYVCPVCRERVVKGKNEIGAKCRIHGVDAEPVKEIDSGGKVNVRYDTSQAPATMPAIELNIARTPIGRLVAENNIKYISYDSITNPTEIYVSGGLNFPGRDDVNGLWFQQIQSLASKFKTTSFGLFHLSINPTSPYDKYGHPIGGKSVGHNFKFVTLLRRLQGALGTPFSTKAEKINVRKMFNMRHPRKTPFGTSSDLVMGDSGLTDSDVAQFDDE